MRRAVGPVRNERGIALLIVLLVTTLLIALIFEFFYGTRVSLRAAVNFRDSQRAYFLARSGVNFAGKLLADNLKNGRPQDNLEQRDWQPVPIISAGDTQLLITWEDEGGKIRIGPGPMDPATQEWFRELLTNTGVDQQVAEKIIGPPATYIRSIPELHKVMSDEEYGKIKDFVTVYSTGAIDVNTASETVLKSVLLGRTTTPDLIMMKRKDKPLPDLTGTDINNTRYATTSNVFLVRSYATVGGYTKQAEAVIQRDTSAFTVLYWKIL